MPQAHGYAAHSPTTPLAPFTFERRAPGPTDVALDILFCGVCHSDLHTVRGEWGNTVYPSVPGHEIVGRVTAVGDLVSKFKIGQLVGVGCMVDSCQHCKPCADGLEQYCDNGFTGTYNGPEQGTGANTYGGYASNLVVRESFVLGISHDEKHLAAVAPLLCAGITTYSPLHQWGVGAGHNTRRLQPDHEAPPPGRLIDRRHQRDAGDAGFLRQAQHRLRHRDDPHGRDRSGLRTHAQRRCEVPLCD